MTEHQITPELFTKLVELAQIALDPQESEYLRVELNHQLSALKELSQIPLEEGITASAHGIECQGSPAREDHWVPFPNPGAIIELAPEVEEGMVAVPDTARAKTGRRLA
ncbi:MAG: Asp-tRNA(Asn)/Glu-tRNA(Gln) amidotransferase subunit GatC [Anaerolineaceae bacterium]|jgi:aspartyl/glutamyl-tRNA(Asn/Gln) amidotransferase C subunit